MADKIILISSNTLGKGDERLGEMLMASLLRTLGENDEKPMEIVFVNAGVKLVCEGSRVLDHVKNLSAQGVEIRACTTCLEYFDLMEKIVAGKPTTMAKTVKSLMNAEVISL